MGYLYDGVSVIDMAGYYQIFGNGGKYYKPEAITKIIDDHGKTIYTKIMIINRWLVSQRHLL